MSLEPIGPVMQQRVSRTDRILAAITAEIERHRGVLDEDQHLSQLTVTLNLNEGGSPRAIIIDRQSISDLTGPKNRTDSQTNRKPQPSSMERP